MSNPVTQAVVGFVAGVLSGAFGVGGGMVTTPAIRLLLGYPELIAVGTPLPVIVPTAVAGAVSYARRGLVDLRMGLTVGFAGVPGTVGGAWLAHTVGGTLVLLITAVLIGFIALDTAISAFRGPRPALIARESRHRFAGVVALGVLAGVYSGFLGLGGGFVIVPVLQRWFGLGIKQAIGTGLVAVAVLAVPGSAAHWALGHVDARLALALAAGVIPGALLGARLTFATGERSVRIGFAALLAGASVLLALNETGVM